MCFFLCFVAAEGPLSNQENIFPSMTNLCTHLKFRTSFSTKIEYVKIFVSHVFFFLFFRRIYRWTTSDIHPSTESDCGCQGFDTIVLWNICWWVNMYLILLLVVFITFIIIRVIIFYSVITIVVLVIFEIFFTYLLISKCYSY